MSYRQGKKRRLTKISIGEVSSVDAPAQEPALALIWKRAENYSGCRIIKSPFEDRRIGILLGATEGHTHLVWLTGQAGETSYQSSEGEDHGHSHPWMISNGQLVIGESGGHTHSVDQSLVMTALMPEMLKSFVVPIDQADQDLLDQYAIALEHTPDSPERREAQAALAARSDSAALDDGSFPITNEADLSNAVTAFETAEKSKRETIAKHIERRATALGVEDQLPTEGPLAALLHKQEASMPATDPKVELDKLAEEKNDLTKRADRLEKVVALTAPERAYFDGLEKAEEQDAFLAKSSDERALDIEKSTEENPVVYTSVAGEEFRKSDDPRLVRLAKERDEDRRELAKSRAEQRQESFRKRADEILPSLPGDLDVRATLVKVIDGIEDETVRNSVFATVKAGNDAMKADFESRGHRQVVGDEGDAEAELDKLAKAHAAEHSVSYEDAYAAVSDENPKLLAKAIGNTTPGR